MLSKGQIKLITSLKQNKFRKQHKLFVAEGIKSISELLKSPIELFHLYTLTDGFEVSEGLKTVISEKELKQISFLKTPNSALALFKVPEPKTVNFDGLVVALDNVRDPGNLGTIIRLCDWFGVKHLICSQETVECYNPKVIQATMGSIARVDVHYLDLQEVLKSVNIPKFGTFTDGTNIYDLKLPQSGILILGNEAHGISSKLEMYITERISIPRFGDLQETESLNVANATAIFLSEFKRRSIET